MVQPEFRDLPVSYRLSQNAMLAAVGAILFSRHLAAIQLPIAAKWGIAGVVGCMVLFALLADSYVVIRYPYLSLVSTRDGDIFARQFTSRMLARVTKSFGLATLLVLLLVIVGVTWAKGIANMLHASSLIYISILFSFAVFLCFFYDADLHPTVATFIRSTLGLGIVLVPLFLPVLIIGSLRCRTLLKSVTAQQGTTGWRANDPPPESPSRAI